MPKKSKPHFVATLFNVIFFFLSDRNFTIAFCEMCYVLYGTVPDLCYAGSLKTCTKNTLSIVYDYIFTFSHKVQIMQSSTHCDQKALQFSHHLSSLVVPSSIPEPLQNFSECQIIILTLHYYLPFSCCLYYLSQCIYSHLIEYKKLCLRHWRKILQIFASIGRQTLLSNLKSRPLSDRQYQQTKVSKSN